jgi:hypothetical protein
MNTSIPRKDADFDERQETITSTVATKGTDWGLNMEWYNTEVVPKKAAWTAAYAPCKDARNRSQNIVLHKNAKRAEYEQALRMLVKMIDGCPGVTDEDREAMGIAIQSAGRKTPVPSPNSFPVCTVDTSMVHRLTVNFRDSDANTKGKPHGVHGAEFRWATLDEAPEVVTKLTNSGFDTRSPFVLDFEENQRGKTVWFAARWETNSGLKGPWGAMFNAVIP